MSTCCSPTSDTLIDRGEYTVALAGNPNCGKTTLFNALTGLRQKVANYPGVTVEKKTGRCKLPDGRWINIIDLPGTYSLISRSPDEQVAMEVLRGLRAGTRMPDAVIVVVDASNLQRNLYLVSQLIELGRPMVVALNMMDIAERRGLRVSAEGLSKALGVPVIPVVGHRGKGIDKLKAALASAKAAPMPPWPLPQEMHEELLLVAGGLAILNSPEGSEAGGDSAGKDGARVAGEEKSALNGEPLAHYQAVAERLLVGDRAADLAEMARREPVASLLNSAAARLSNLGIDPMQADIEAHYRWIESVARAAIAPDASPGSSGGAGAGATAAPKRTLTEKADSILVHRVWGLVCFALIMAALFISIFWVAKPLMNGVQDGATWLGNLVGPHLPAGPIRDLWTDGIVAGVGAVVVFVPQIAMLFLFLAILEDSGYLARAAFLMDRMLAKVGLSGKSFIPLLSSFACAIPGIMATRTIESRKDRLATIFVAPFMSCSARLPVYFLLIGTFFGGYSAWVQGGLMLSLYLLGIVAAVVTAFFFKRTFLSGPATSFILELPTYKPPQVSQVARVVLLNTWEFVTKAGTTIFCLSVILWALTYYPRMPKSQVAQVTAAQVQSAPTAASAPGTATAAGAAAPAEGTSELDQAVASAQLRYSLAGRFGHVIEPVIRPLGYDWKMGVGLVGAFAAREVFVSTMAITYSAGSEDNTADLSSAMRADRYPNGRPVWSAPVALSLLVWFVLAMQCMSTLAIVRRETGGWKWPLFMLGYMNALAYVVAFAVFQIGTRL